MNCFYHPGAPAVGVCKNCFRGVCGECSAPEMEGVACRGRCEEKVRALIALQDRALRSFGIAAGAYTRSAVFIALMGILFFGYGYRFTDANPGLKFFLEVFGALFILGAAFYAYAAAKYKK